MATVGCAGAKTSGGASEQGTVTGTYDVSSGSVEGTLGDEDGGTDGGSGSGGSDGGSGSDGSGSSDDGGSGSGSSGDSGSGDSGSGSGGSGGSSSSTDADGDGFDATEDCDDTNPDIYPGATEYCNGIDDNCDGSLDRDAIDKVTSYEDADRDGYGNPDVYLWACNVPSDHVLNADDCDDTDARRNPELGCDWNGTYTGTIALTATISGVSDTCSATLDLDVDESANPAAFGENSCSWAGLAASLIGDVDFEIEGDFTAADEIEGDVTIDGFGSESWSGTFTSPGNIYGTASGSGTYEGYSYTYTLELDLDR